MPNLFKTKHGEPEARWASLKDQLDFRKGLYVYKPLNKDQPEIRLFTLLKGKPTDKIRILIYVTTLLDYYAPQIPVFEAISYAWGDPKDTAELFVGRGGRTLSVTRNLGTALSHLRYEDRDRTLWADAICINQADLVERGNQVQRMAGIFRTAERVLVWTGIEENDSSYALNHVAAMDTAKLGNPLLNPLSPISKRMTPCGEREAKALASFMKRSCFTRLWIWPEIWLGRRNATVHCGNHDIPWSQLEDVVMCLYRKWALGHLVDSDWHEVIDSAWTLFLLCQIVGGQFSLLSLVYQCKMCQCSNPLDRVYAVLSIVDPSDKALRIVPDYTKPEVDVFQDICLAYVENMKSLIFLQYCAMTEESSAPSWVPRFDPKFDLSVSPHDSYPGNADGNSAADAKYLGEGVLGVTGIGWDTVDTVDMPFVECQRSLEAIVAKLCDWKPADAYKKPYMAGGTLLEAYCRTLCAGAFRDEFMPSGEGLPDFDRLINFLKSHLELSAEVRSKWLAKNLENGLHSDLRFVANQQELGKIFVTREKDAFGVVYGSVLPGDKVCILLGLQSPICLRRVESGQYQVVGTCYIHGLMNGEALLGPLPPNIRRRVDRAADDPAFSTHLIYEDIQSGTKDHRDPRIMELLGDSVTRDDTEVYQGYLQEARSLMTPEKLMERNIPLETFELI